MVHAFLLIGQSNMAGRGLLKDAASIRDTRIKVLRNGRWQVMWEPIHNDRPFAGVGPAASFAQAWLNDNPDGEIGLIPCADGGSSLGEWMPGGPLFDHAVLQAKLAQRISVIDGILWHQGETDCMPERIEVYAKKLQEMLQTLRQELQLPKAPILIGGLGDYLPRCTLHDYFVNAPRMNDVLLRYTQMHEDTYFVTAQGLESNADLLHFNAPSQRVFGFRYYRAYKSRASVLCPIDNEDEILAVQQESANMTPEEKAAELKKQLDDGIITRQEYNFRIDTLISGM